LGVSLLLSVRTETPIGCILVARLATNLKNMLLTAVMLVRDTGIARYWD
jgi:hypothetical protein